METEVNLIDVFLLLGGDRAGECEEYCILFSVLNMFVFFCVMFAKSLMAKTTKTCVSMFFV